MNKIVLVIPTLDKGGTESQIYLIIKELLSRKIHTILILFKYTDLINEFDKKYFDVKYILNRRFSFFTLFKYLFNISKGEDEIVVLSFLLKMNIYVGLMTYFLDFKWISSERSDPSFNNSIYSRIELFLKRRSVVSCNSNFAKEFYEYKGYTSLYFRNIINCTHKKGIVFGPKYVMLNRLVNYKNVDIVLRAWNIANIRGELIIIGDGPDRQKLIDLNNDLGLTNVSFKGRLDVPSKFLEGTSFFISASSLEGCPNSALEALCYNNVLILSDIEGHAELITRHTPYIFSSFNIGDLVRVLKHSNCLNYNEYINDLKSQQEILMNFSPSFIDVAIDEILDFSQKISS